MIKKQLVVSLSPNRLKRFNKKWIRRKSILKFNALLIPLELKHEIFNAMRDSLNKAKNESAMKIVFEFTGLGNAELKIIKSFISLNAANYLLNASH